jgi:hypothetical protein
MQDYNKILNDVLPFIENNKEFIEEDLFNFFQKNEIFRYLEKKLISFEIKRNQDGNIYFNDEFFFNDKTHFNTLLYYNKYSGRWQFFYGNIDEDDKNKIYLYFKGLVRKLKIENIKKLS